jgi:hypothetical protein
LSGRIEESFLRRVKTLPADTQLLLLAAAAEPVGDSALLWSAAEQLGIVRSAIYRAATHAERQKVHRALAEVISNRTSIRIAAPGTAPSARRVLTRRSPQSLNDPLAGRVRGEVSRQRLRSWSVRLR